MCCNFFSKIEKCLRDDAIKCIHYNGKFMSLNCDKIKMSLLGFVLGLLPYVKIVDNFDAEYEVNFCLFTSYCSATRPYEFENGVLIVRGFETITKSLFARDWLIRPTHRI